MRQIPKLQEMVKIMVPRKVLLAFVIAALMVGQPVSGVLTQVVTDPAGDTLTPVTPAFQDIVEASVTKSGQTFIFGMRLAGPLPQQPPLPPPGVAETWWQWGINTDPTTFPAGFPFIPSISGPPEFMALVKSDGVQYTAFLIDRRPLLTGGDAIVTPILFSIAGSEVTVSVNAKMLGRPERFGFAAFTVDWAEPPPGEGFNVIDIAGPARFPP